MTTSEGIILIDTIFPYNSSELIVGGLQKLGLNPKNIKYVLISHAHQKETFVSGRNGSA